MSGLSTYIQAQSDLAAAEGQHLAAAQPAGIQPGGGALRRGGDQAQHRCGGLWSMPATAARDRRSSRSLRSIRCGYTSMCRKRTRIKSKSAMTSP